MLQRAVSIRFSSLYFPSNPEFLLRFGALVAVMLAGLAVQPLHAQRLAEMPQTPAFAEAYDKALALAKEFPGSRVVTVASTYSMYPTLDWDSLVVVAPTSLNQVRVGDVVCFRDKNLEESRTILHRVERIMVKGGRLVTRGDHLEQPDPHPVPADALVGKAVYVVYFDRTGEQRPVSFSMPTLKRCETVVKLLRD
jgi:signal peptidase I